MKIAYFSPLKPARSGISDYSTDLISVLRRYFDIHLYYKEPVDFEIYKDFKLFHYSQFKPKGYNAIIYHMGNHPYHEFIYKSFIRFPGILVLHDIVLHHFFHSLPSSLYFRELKRCYGKTARRIFLMAKFYGYREGFLERLFYYYPMHENLVKRSRICIVHSRWARKIIGEKGFYIPHIYLDRKIKNVEKEDRFIVGIFGHIIPSKRIESIIYAFRKFIHYAPKSLLLIVGEEKPTYRISNVIKKFIPEENYKITGYVSDEEFLKYLSLSSVVINLRYPSCGEMSWTLIKALGMGKCVLISDHGPYQEFPEDTVIKISVGERESQEILDALLYLYRNPDVREEVGSNARIYIMKNHSPEVVAERFRQIINYFL